MNRAAKVACYGAVGCIAWSLLCATPYPALAAAVVLFGLDFYMEKIAK